MPQTKQVIFLMGARDIDDDMIKVITALLD